MRISPAAGIAEHRRAAFPWDNAVNPQGKGKRVTTGGGVGWLPIAATKNPEETWAVFAHLGGAQAAKAMATVWYPARKSALSWLLAQDPTLPPKSRNVGADGQEIMAPDPIFPAWDEIEREVLTPELTALWNNEKTAHQCVDAAVPKVNAVLQAQPR
jgi:ABC-type glycerol-3-phosphate transport system substrate-binding protein